jgi:hypothetical protein
LHRHCRGRSRRRADGDRHLTDAVNQVVELLDKIFYGAGIRLSVRMDFLPAPGGRKFVLILDIEGLATRHRSTSWRQREHRQVCCR